MLTFGKDFSRTIDDNDIGTLLEIRGTDTGNFVTDRNFV